VTLQRCWDDVQGAAMKIGELAKTAQTQTETIRYYEREGLLPEAARTGANYRIYDQSHLQRLAFHTPLPLAGHDKRPRGRPRKTLLASATTATASARADRGAARLFRRKGFAATSTRDIAAACRHAERLALLPLQEQAGAAVRGDGRTGMRSALERQAHATSRRRSACTADHFKSKLAARHGCARPSSQLRVLVRNHFEVLLGPGSDFIPVMLYESRSITPRQRTAAGGLQSDYEAPWEPVLRGAACRRPAQGRSEAGAPA
jgi:hypothetical protein